MAKHLNALTEGIGGKVWLALKVVAIVLEALELVEEDIFVVPELVEWPEVVLECLLDDEGWCLAW
jgi:hypothetical protein